MGMWDRFGRGTESQSSAEQQAGDEQAIARYRYMLRTAPPEAIEQAHAEAFAALTPEQRRRVLEELKRELPESERATVLRAGDSPSGLARLATRAEIREPGAMERIFGGIGRGTPWNSAAPGVGGPGIGGLLAGSFLASMAGTVLGSMVGHQFFNSDPGAQHLFGATADASRFDDLSKGVEDFGLRGDGAGDSIIDTGGFDGGFDTGTFDI